MPKLNDTHMILLSAASQHDTGSLYPLPVALAGTGERTTQAIATLIKHGLAAEQETEHAGCIHRVDGDCRYGIFITENGLAAIGVGEGSAATPAPAPAAKPATQTKSATVIALLKREDGATMSELIAATSWLPHTTRAALTGLRKKGHVVERSKRADETCYRITA